MNAFPADLELNMTNGELFSSRRSAECIISCTRVLPHMAVPKSIQVWLRKCIDRPGFACTLCALAMFSCNFFCQTGADMHATCGSDCCKGLWQSWKESDRCGSGRHFRFTHFIANKINRTDWESSRIPDDGFGKFRRNAEGRQARETGRDFWKLRWRFCRGHVTVF